MTVKHKGEKDNIGPANRQTGRPGEKKILDLEINKDSHSHLIYDKDNKNKMLGGKGLIKK